MYSGINEAIQSVPRRANQRLSGTFANIPNRALLPTLRSANSQIVIGRAGMGKTHLLLELERYLREEGKACAFVDVEAVGTASDLYGNSPETWDHSLRATRLAVDALESIHDALRIGFLDDESMDTETARWLKDLGESITQVRVAGEEERSEKRESKELREKDRGLSLDLGLTAPGASARISGKQGTEELSSTMIVQKGQADVWLHLTSVRRAFEGLGSHRDGLFVLLDSWDSLPPLLQPWLADLIRRLLWNTPNCVVKIAAKESPRFEKALADGRLGLSTSDEAVIDLDARAAALSEKDQQEWLLGILHEQVKSVMARVFVQEDPGDDLDDFIEVAFADRVAAETFVEAAENNPRDALTLADRAAQAAGLSPLKESDVVTAAASIALARRVPQLSLPAGLETWFSDFVVGRGISRAFYVPLLAGQAPAVFRDMYERRLLHTDHRSQTVDGQSPHEKFAEWHIDFGYALNLQDGTSGQPVVSVPSVRRVEASTEAVIPIYREKDLLQERLPPPATGPVAEIRRLPGPWVEAASESLSQQGDFLLFDQEGRFETVRLVEVPVLLGRSSKATVQILEPTVSARHAELSQNAMGGWRIRDCDSKNGVTVNGKKVDTADLQSHDTIGLGAAEIIFVRRTSSSSLKSFEEEY